MPNKSNRSIAPEHYSRTLTEAVFAHFMAEGTPASVSDIANNYGKSETTVRKQIRDGGYGIERCDFEPVGYTANGGSVRERDAWLPNRSYLREQIAYWRSS